MTKLFYGVYIEEPISSVIDLIRYISEPDSFRFSHLTIRGPYSRKIKDSDLANLNSQVSHWIVSIEKVGNFFLGSQNTVYLAMDIGPLRKLWYKPDFPDGKSHITLYDGPDREYARGLFNLAEHYKWQGMLKTSKLKLLGGKISINSDYLIQMMGLVEAYEKYASAGRPSLADIPKVGKMERLNIIGDILQALRLPPASYA